MADYSVKEVLKTRDGMTDAEMEEEYLYAKEEIQNIINSGGSYDDVEDFMLGELGLEMDYLFDLL